jgi:sulfite exporter TauE/SafE
VNGSGAVNGFRLSYEQRRVGAVRVDFRKRLLIIAVLVVIIVALPYALVYSFTEQTVEIDGYFMDWVKAQIFKDTPDSTNPDISLIGYGAK